MCLEPYESYISVIVFIGEYFIQEKKKVQISSITLPRQTHMIKCPKKQQTNEP